MRRTNLNRTKIGIKTAVIVVVSTILQSILILIRTKVILDVYGSNVNAVLQIAVQLSAYLLLFESGMGDAYRYYIYSPLHNKDYNKVASLFHGLKKNMRDIATKMLVVSILFAFLYSIYLDTKGVAFFDALMIISVMGIRLVIPYYIIVPLQTMIITKEKKYIVDTVQGLTICTSLLIEILLALYTHLPLQVILSIYIGLIFLTYPVYLRIVNNLYDSKLIRNGYDDSPRAMTKDILIHQISGLVFNNTDNAILSFFSTLENVTIYSSFNNLIRFPVILLTNIISGIRASFALKVAANDKDTYIVFKELFVLEGFFVSCVIPVFILMANDFVKLWIGEKYQLNQVAIILFALLLTHYLLMPALFAARDSKGLYKKSKNYTVFQAILKLVVSMMLVSKMGITGLLLGALISTSLVVEPFTFKLVYREVFKRKVTLYKDYAFFIFLCIISVLISSVAIKFIFLNGSISWLIIILKTIIILIISSTVAFLGLFIFSESFKHLLERLWSIFFKS